jgi:hypothetical protein
MFLPISLALGWKRRIAVRLILHLGEHLEGFGLRRVEGHLAGLDAFVILIEDRYAAFHLRAQHVEALAINIVGKGGKLEIDGDGKGRHQRSDQYEQLMRDLQFLHFQLALSLGAAKNVSGLIANSKTARCTGHPVASDRLDAEAAGNG